MSPHSQVPEKLPSRPVQATIPRNQQRKQEDEVDPELVAQMVGYGLFWVLLVGFAIATVAMAMGRLP